MKRLLFVSYIISVSMFSLCNLTSLFLVADEKVFELLGRVGRRLDDQRGHLRPQDLELPEFLQPHAAQITQNTASPASKRPKSEFRMSSSVSAYNVSDNRRVVRTPHGARTSEGAGDGKLRKTPLHNSDSSIYDSSVAAGGDTLKKSASQESIAPGSCVSARSMHISPSKIPFMDQSFGENGIVPTHAQADDYFASRKYDDEANFDDSKLMERTLRDIGLESKPLTNSPKNGVFLSGVRVNTPISELKQRLSSPRKPDFGESQQRVLPSGPVPKPRVPKRRKAPGPPQQPFATPLPHNTRLSPEAYIAQEGDVEITLLPPSSTDSEDSVAERFPSPPPAPSAQGTLSKTPIANYPPPAPLASQENSPVPTPPVRNKRRLNSAVTSPRQNPPRPAQRPAKPDRFPKKFDSSSRSETSTPSPTTHDLILDGFGNAPKDSQLTVAEKQVGSRANGRVGGRTRRVLAVEYDEDEDKDVQVSYV